MKFQLERNEGRNAITGYGADHILVNGVRLEGNLVLQPEGEAVAWAQAGFACLTVEDFEQLRDLAPEIVLIGTGRTQRFPPPALLRPLMEAQIGFEVMDLGGVCRTYNVLMGEGRRVVAALMFD